MSEEKQINQEQNHTELLESYNEQLDMSIRIKKAYEDDIEIELERLKALYRKLIHEENKLDQLKNKIDALNEIKTVIGQRTII